MYDEEELVCLGPDRPQGHQAHETESYHAEQTHRDEIPAIIGPNLPGESAKR